jgi:hypothetical protein
LSVKLIPDPDPKHCLPVYLYAGETALTIPKNVFLTQSAFLGYKKKIHFSLTWILENRPSPGKIKKVL